jgi:uncharacterized membrane protein YgdD (TMEM256/DUF423 family)
MQAFINHTSDVISLTCIQMYNNKFYTSKFVANGNKAVPEARLPPMMVGSVFFAGGLFIFGWASSASIFWLAPVIGLVCMGFGFFTIFKVLLFPSKLRATTHDSI